MRYWVAMVWLLTAVIGLQAQDIQDEIPGIQLTDEVTLIRVFPRFDDTTHTVSLFTQGTWHTIPYPANFTTPISVSPDADNTYIVTTEDEQYQRTSWILDPQTDTLSRFASKCPSMEEDHGMIYQSFVVSHATWITIQNGPEVSFCHPFTGETTPTLRTDLVWMNPEISPGGRYFMIQAHETERNEPYSLYSYERETHVLRFLGKIEEHIYPPLFLSAWLTPTKFMMASRDMPEWSITYIYIGDVAQENSFQHAMSRTRYAPRLIMQPLSFENMPADDGDGPDLGPCSIFVYDVELAETHAVNTGSLCDEGLIIPDGSGDRLYRSNYPDASVVRFNVTTGARKTLYRGEVESIFSVSPDGTYAIVGLGDQGRVETIQDGEGNSEFLSGGNSSLYVMRLTDGAIIGWAPYARWLSNSVLTNGSYIYAITDTNPVVTHVPGEILLTAFAEPDLWHYDISYELLLPPSFKGFMILRTEDNRIWFYAPHQRQPRLLMRVSPETHLEVTSLEDNTLRFTAFEMVPVPDDQWKRTTKQVLWSMDVRLR